MLIYTSLERERILLNTIIFVTGIVQLLELCLPNYPADFFFLVSPVIWLKKIVGHCGKLCHPTDLSVRWAESLEYEATKQSQKCLLHTITITPIKLLLNHTLGAFYPLKPHKGSSLEQLLWGLAPMDKEGFKRREIYFCLSFQQTQKNTLHLEELVRIPWTQGIKADFNTKLNYIPSSDYRLLLSLIQNLTQAGVYNLDVNYNICPPFFRWRKRNLCWKQVMCKGPSNPNHSS